MSRDWKHAVLLVGLVALMPACASKKYVRTQVEPVDEATATNADNIATVAAQVERNEVALAEQQKQLDSLSQTTREALERAMAAGKLAEGKFLYETVLSDESVRFAFDDASLSEGARAALDEFAAGLLQRNENVYVEIQGHTDSTGGEDYNLKLGARRAEAVRGYLNLRHGLPLHRLAVISYGETAPVADNGSRDGRARNRRVALVVLK